MKAKKTGELSINMKVTVIFVVLRLFVLSNDYLS